VFGGGAVLANMTTLNIGDRNSDFVLRYLRNEQRIEVAAQDLRGPHARRVCFVPSTGKAIVRKLRAQTEVLAGTARRGRAAAQDGWRRASWKATRNDRRHGSAVRATPALRKAPVAAIKGNR
jgi:chemotaxis protein CheD